MSQGIANKAFKNIQKDITISSELTRVKKQVTKYKNIKRTLEKNNYKKIQKWNSHVKLSLCALGWGVEENDYLNNKTCENLSTLISTDSYEELLDLTKGKSYANPILSGNTQSEFNSYFGVFTQVGFRLNEDIKNIIILTYPFNSGGMVSSSASCNSGSGTECCTNTASCIDESFINTIAFPNNSQCPVEPFGFENVPGYIVDPYAYLYMGICDRLTSNVNNKVYTTQLEFRWLLEYWQVVIGDTLSNFKFPTRISFSSQFTDLSKPITYANAPLPRPLTKHEENPLYCLESANFESCKDLSEEQYLFWKRKICFAGQ